MVLPNNIACAWVGENNEKGAVWGVREYKAIKGFNLLCWIM